MATPWSHTVTRNRVGELEVGDMPVSELAAEFQTPLWVLDEADLRARCRSYVSAFAGATVAYASKAWCNRAVLQVIGDEGLSVDVASGGELFTALAAGIAPERILFHGNNKSVQELNDALDAKVGRIVIDSCDELARLEALAKARDVVVPVWLRITPGIDAHTHEYVRTGHDDQKFGFTLSLGLADEAFAQALAAPHINVVGIHAHIGSQIFGVEAFVANAQVMIELLHRWREQFGVTLPELNLGGGMGIAYTSEDDPVDVSAFGVAVRDAVAAQCALLAFPQPALFVEPGRALIAPSTLTLYEVGTIKVLPGLTTWVSVDGGMSDNIRPSLYGAVHEVTLASRSSSRPQMPVSVVGKHCESGDLIRDTVELPDDLAVGDLLAVAATGAYTASMASNYNRLPRPAAVMVHKGTVRIVQQRETYADLLRFDGDLS
ncbi:MAG: diaminopimelate decarboxylase [Nitriliruptoraceae bacterium]